MGKHCTVTVILFKLGVVFQHRACYTDTHQQRALCIHVSQGGLSHGGGDSSSTSAFYCRAARPAQDWRCVLPLVLLFISSLLFTVEWAPATLWSVLRALLLFQEGRRVWPKLTELNVGQAWRNHQRPCRTGVFASAPLTFGTRQSFGVGTRPVHCRTLGSTSGVYPLRCQERLP